MDVYVVFMLICILLFILFSVVIVVAIAWTHYPQGIIRAWWEKKKD